MDFYILGGQNYGQKFDFDPSFEGPVKNRSCTDVLCLLLFLVSNFLLHHQSILFELLLSAQVFLGGWGFVAYLGISTGDIEKVKFIITIIACVVSR